MRDILQYYLFNKNRKPLYLDDNNQVQEGNEFTLLKPDGNPARLKESPDGWKDTNVKYARNNYYWGLFRDMITPMKFVGDGRKILRHQMWSSGVDNITHIGITKLDQLNLPYNYKKFHLSEINFPKYKERETEIEVEALEGGLSKFLKAREDTIYTIPLDEVSVILDGMSFDFSRTFGVIEGQTYPDGPGRYYMGVIETGIEGNVLDILFQNMQNEPQVLQPNDKYIMRPLIEKAVRMSGNIRGITKQDTGVAIGITLDKNFGPFDPGGVVTVDYEFYNASLSNNQIFSFDFDETFTIPADYQIYPYLSGGTGDENGLDSYELTGGEIKIEYIYRYKTTTVPGIWLLTALRRLVEKLSDGKYTADSTWLSSKKDIVLTSGDALRGIDAAVMKTSLRKFFKSLNSHFSICLFIKNDVLWVEQKSFAHQSTVILDLGEVKDATITFAEDISGNSVKVGGPLVDYTDVNGKYEVNQGQIWSLPLTKHVAEIDLSSDFRSDPLGVELLRINFEQKKTTDSEGDNDTFMLHVKDESQIFTTLAEFGTDFNVIQLTGQAGKIGQFPSGSVFNITGSLSNNGSFIVNNAYVSGANLWLFVELASPVVTESSIEVTVQNNKVSLRRDVIPTAGVPHPESIFNVELSGKHGLLRNGPFLRSLLDYLDAEKIKLTSYDKNVKLVSDIVENSDIQVGSIGNRLFLPYYIMFTAEIPMNTLDLLNNNPYGKIKFRWNNQAWYGWLWDGGIKPSENDSQEIKLLSAPENKLIKFNS